MENRAHIKLSTIGMSFYDWERKAKDRESHFALVIYFSLARVYGALGPAPSAPAPHKTHKRQNAPSPASRPARNFFSSKSSRALSIHLSFSLPPPKGTPQSAHTQFVQSFIIQAVWLFQRVPKVIIF
jgi:hypothetical protein